LHLYPIYLSHYLTYHVINTFDNLKNIYNNKYRDIDITVIAKKTLTNVYFFFDSTIYIKCSICSNTNFMSSISPLYYFQNNTDKYFISPINNCDYISDSSYTIIGLNNERKAIIKFNSIQNLFIFLKTLMIVFLRQDMLVMILLILTHQPLKFQFILIKDII
jgi:hypothetical protein